MPAGVEFLVVVTWAFGLPEWLLLSSPLSWLARLAGNRTTLIARIIRFAATAFLER